MLDSVIKANKKYYPQKFLEECKYVPKKAKIENNIDDGLKKSESDSILMMRQNLILIMMMNMTNNFLKVFKHNKSLHISD